MTFLLKQGRPSSEGWKVSAWGVLWVAPSSGHNCAVDLKVEWTEQALNDAASMAAFIASKWTDREVLRFFSLLVEFEDTIATEHLSYPRSVSYPGCHRAVIHRNASVI